MYHNKKTRAQKKRKYGIGREFTATTIGEDTRKKIKAKGGKIKVKLPRARYVNLVDKGKNIRCEITSVADNQANKDYKRRNIITRGTLLEVTMPDGKEAKVKVTSRPGQDGVINAVAA